MKKICKRAGRAIVAASVVGAGLGLGALALSQPAQAAPRRTLEIWPGQRVLLVLPLQISPAWNAGAELGEAIKPVVRPQLQSALTATDKFAVTLPYRFDPILRRAITDKRVEESAVTDFVTTPTLESAQTILSQLTFNQVPMVAQIQLEELRVGGTQKQPTVQLVASGKLYEVGGSLFRNVVVTSKSYGGRTPEARLQAAANDAFSEIARQFVEPPAEFQLPLPPAATPKTATTSNTPVTPAGTVTTTPEGTITTTTAQGIGGGTLQSQTFTPNGATPKPANGMATTPGAPFIPQLPSAGPPLGVAAPGVPTLPR